MDKNPGLAVLASIVTFHEDLKITFDYNIILLGASTGLKKIVMNR